MPDILFHLSLRYLIAKGMYTIFYVVREAMGMKNQISVALQFLMMEGWYRLEGQHSFINSTNSFWDPNLC